MRRNAVIAGLVCASIAVAFVPATSAAQETAKKQITARDLKDAKPTATVEVDAEQLRLFIGGSTGKGVLRFKGQEYPFTIKAVIAGGVGYTKVHATGDVYFLERIEDFAGRYTAIGAGATAVKGATRASFENDKGVYVSLRSKTEGVGLSLGVSVAMVEFVKK